jgi:hypothetical protein
MGPRSAARATPRLALIRSFAAAIVRAVRTGDMSAARVGHEALGKLLEDQTPSRTDAEVTPARTRRGGR